MKRDFNPFALKWQHNVVCHMVMAGFALLCIFPFAFVIILSLSSEHSLAMNGYSLFPESWSFESYRYLWEMRETIFRAYGVTALITFLGTCISVLMTTMFAYAISRKQFVYRRFFTFLVFFTMLFSGGLVPFYIVMTQLLQLKNSIWALIMPMALNAFHIIVMRTFFQRNIPDSIIESAQIEGAGEFRILFQIVIPMALPGIATIALFSTLAYWNDWFNALLFIEDAKLLPIQAVLMRIESNMEFIRKNAMISGQAGNLLASIPQDAARMAMVVVATLPIALSYPFFQKYFISGLTVGGVKE